MAVMTALRRVVNRSAVRAAFRGHGARVPRGFMDEVEQTVYVQLRRAAAGEIEPSEGAPAEDFLKQSLLKEAVRDAFGKPRADGAWLAHLNGVVAAKVMEAAARSGARANGIFAAPAMGIPGRVLRTFLRSEESKSMTLSTFHRRWQNAAFRQQWMDKHPLDTGRL